MVVLLIVGLLELHLHAFQGDIDRLAHVVLIGRGDDHGTGDVDADFAVTLVFDFVVKDYGGVSDVRVELCQFVHFFLNTVLETGRCIKVASRKLNIHMIPPYN